MKRNPEATCETCPYLHIDEDVDIESRSISLYCTCRRRSPRTALGVNHVWPFVEMDGWCGEHPKFGLDQIFWEMTDEPTTP